jgi:hypothetical protein
MTLSWIYISVLMPFTSLLLANLRVNQTAIALNNMTCPSLARNFPLSVYTCTSQYDILQFFSASHSLTLDSSEDFNKEALFPVSNF